MGAAVSAGGGLFSGAVKSISGNGGLLGQEGGGPDAANIQQGTSVDDVKKAQGQAGNSLQSQNNLLSALQNQNGLGMQSTAANNQQGLANQLSAANGVGVQQNAISGLQSAANQYQNIANGTGPNPAQAMLNQATGQNVANQAALMAGQRGAGANVGLLARQAAQQGANTQQQAVGQGAVMQANQSLNALSGLTNANQAVGNLGSGLTTQQTNANQAYANQANTIAGQQINQANVNAQNALTNQQQMQNALQGVNNANVGSQSSVNQGNVSLSQSNSKAKQDITGGIMNSLGGGATGGGAAAGGARGGIVHLAYGGQPAQMTPMTAPPEQNMTPMAPPAPVGAQSSFGQYMTAAPAVAPPADEEDNVEESKDMTKPKNTDPFMSSGDSQLKKGVSSLTRAVKMAAAKGGLANGGGHVTPKNEAQKAEKSGNSYSNDKIPAMLSAGEIVLPRSITQSGDPVRASADFVAKVLAKKKVKK